MAPGTVVIAAALSVAGFGGAFILGSAFGKASVAPVPSTTTARDTQPLQPQVSSATLSPRRMQPVHEVAVDCVEPAASDRGTRGNRSQIAVLDTSEVVALDLLDPSIIDAEFAEIDDPIADEIEAQQAEVLEIELDHSLEEPAAEIAEMSDEESAEHARALVADSLRQPSEIQNRFQDNILRRETLLANTPED